MRKKFEKLIDSIKFSNIDDGTKYNFSLSVFRSLLAYSSLGALTIAESLADEDDLSTLSQCAKKLTRPADGDFVSILDTLLPIIWVSDKFPSTSGWFREGISKKCYGIVFERNDRLGHGVFDHQTAQTHSALISKIEQVIDCIGDLLPTVNSSAELAISGLEFPVQFPPNELCCLREVARKSDGWKYRYQTLDITESIETVGFLPEDGLFPRLLSENRSILNSRSITEDWHPVFLLPTKQTTSFLGRSEQIDHLTEWWDDEYSRICLLFGEGGIGKTTLVLEFVNRILDEEIQTEWKPEYIFFFSSKQTRWGVNGMEQIPGVQTNLSEAVIRLVSALDVTTINQSWYTASSFDLVTKAAQLIKEIGLKGKILIIIDNAENLIRKRQDESDLSALIKLISRKIGRIIVTSRRREELEAEPINVPPLVDDDAADLLEQLLDEYGIETEADREKRKSYVKTIGCKPILIEFLAKYSAMTNATLEKGIQEILKQESSHLGQFLFADSWGRIEKSSQYVFMAIAQLGGFVDDALLALVTDSFGVRRDDWMSAYDETRYGDTNFFSGKQEIILDEGARSFISGRYTELDKETKKKIDVSVHLCRTKYTDYLAAQRMEVKDRIEQAFVHPLARQAKIAYSKGDGALAKDLFEQAIVADAANPYLYDRFAWFSMKHLRDLDVAENLAKHACSLAPTDPEVHFTLGMIYARKGNIQNSDKHLGYARSNGKARNLVLLQMAYARYTSAWKSGIHDEECTPEKFSDLLNASKIGAPKTKAHHRHNDEIESLRAKIKTLLKKNQHKP